MFGPWIVTLLCGLLGATLVQANLGPPAVLNLGPEIIETCKSWPSSPSLISIKQGTGGTALQKAGEFLSKGYIRHGGAQDLSETRVVAEV